MRFGTMWRDVWQSFFRGPITRPYPFERVEAPEHFRGVLHWDPAKCTGCRLCSHDCPANAIELITLDKKNRRFVMRFHMDRCAYCGQCVESCRFKCLGMPSTEWELAALNKEAFTVTYGRAADVEAFLNHAPCPLEEPSPGAASP